MDFDLNVIHFGLILFDRKKTKNNPLIAMTLNVATLKVRQVLCGEFQARKRFHCGLTICYKDTLKASLKCFNIPTTESWEQNAHRIEQRYVSSLEREQLRMKQIEHRANRSSSKLTYSFSNRLKSSYIANIYISCR